MPVFTSTTGTPVEPKSFSEHFYRAQRALGIRPRGLYCTKDTFVTTALEAGVKIAWLEQQTGVRYGTLRKHYGRWMPREAGSELRRFAASPRWTARFSGRKRVSLLPQEGSHREQTRQVRDFAASRKCEEGDLNPHGFYPTSPSN